MYWVYRVFFFFPSIFELLSITAVHWWVARFNHQKIIKNSPEHWWEEWFLSIAALMDCSFRFRFTHKIFYHLWDRWFLSIIDGQLDLSNDTVGTGSPSHWLATMSINHQPLIIMITEKIKYTVLVRPPSASILIRSWGISQISWLGYVMVTKIQLAQAPFIMMSISILSDI